MIVDRIDHAADYAAQLPHLQDAVALIRELKDPAPGKHPFPGGYLMYQSGQTRAADEGGYEAHRKYADVQILLEGRELILWDRLENMEETAPYNAETDKLALRGSGSILEMRPGMFCVLFPTDAHTACRHEAGGAPGPYAKYVVKLEL